MKFDLRFRLGDVLAGDIGLDFDDVCISDKRVLSQLCFLLIDIKVDVSAGGCEYIHVDVRTGLLLVEGRVENLLVNNRLRNVFKIQGCDRSELRSWAIFDDARIDDIRNVLHAGVAVLRVHDVGPIHQVVTMASAMGSDR